MTEGEVDGGVGVARKSNNISSLSHPAAGKDCRKVLTPRAENALVCSHLPVVHFERDVSSNFLEKHLKKVFAEPSRLAARDR